MDEPPGDAASALVIIAHATRALAQAETITEVKSLRDRAEAARLYAKSAALGLQLQNLAAELKLRAERKAGDILAKLSLRGGDRKSKSRDETLKLADLGIDRNKSARWQLQASIPESVFQDYLDFGKKSGVELTSHGLMKLASVSPRRKGYGNGQASNRGHDHRHRVDDAAQIQEAAGNCQANPGALSSASRAPKDIAIELESQRQLLSAIITPLCRDQPPVLELVGKRTVVRLLAEMQQLIAELMPDHF